MEPYIPEVFIPEVKNEEIEDDALPPAMFPDCTLGLQDEKEDELILDDMKEEDIKIEEEDLPPPDPLMILGQQGQSSEEDRRTNGENNTPNTQKTVVDPRSAKRPHDRTSNPGDMTCGSDNLEVGHGSKSDYLFDGGTAEPTIYLNSSECSAHPTKRQKVKPMQLVGDSLTAMTEEAPLSFSCPPQQFVHGDHQNFQSMLIHPPGVFSDGQQNRLASHKDNFNGHSIFSTTAVPLPTLSSAFSTSVAPPQTNGTSSTFLHAQHQENLESAMSEAASSDDSNDQTSHPDPILKVLKEKNIVFERTIAMMVQEQERHDKQLNDMQEHHKKQMKMMQEQHEMWLKMQKDNLNSMLQIQQLQDQLQTSIQQLWQNISNRKGP